jgi:hypothetical protein
MNADLFATPAARAAAISPESAIIVADYPYGFRLRCTMRVWVEFKPGKGFRYCTQTSNPKKPGVWNAAKKGTYARVSMAIGIMDDGHLFPASLSEYSALPEYAEFWAANHDAMSDDARGSFDYFREVKEAYENKRVELGVDNIFSATPAERTEITRSYLPVVAAHIKAGTAY